MQKHEVVSWIRRAFNAENYIQFKLELDTEKLKSEGYTSDMVYGKVILAGSDRKVKKIHIAVKFSKKALRQVPMMKEVYKREMLFYDKIVTTFTEFQEERNITEPFNAVAKCYSVLTTNEMEVLVLENLSKSGFKLHKANLTMNMSYFKLVFKQFAKFHALSFALRDKNEQLFKNITQEFTINPYYLETMQELLIKSSKKVVENLREAQRNDLAESLDNLIEPGVEVLLEKILNDNLNKSVLAHFDCHCNNFMFKYKDNNEETPEEVVILDWQVCQLHSPVIDLSYFFYSVASKKELSERLTLLKYYHDEFSTFLLDLGCNPDLLYPFSTLMEEWKKYSFYGFIHACCYMDFNYFDDDNNPSLDNVNFTDPNNSISSLLSNGNLKDTSLYNKRIVDIVEHYFDKNFD